MVLLTSLEDVTGPDDAKKAILFIFDVFGYFPQSLQGADILANSDDHQKYKVFIPDWFDGKPCPIEWYAFHLPAPGAPFGRDMISVS